MNGVQTRLKCKPNVKRCKRFVFAAHSPLLHPNTLKTKAIIHFQTDHILTRFVFPPLKGQSAQTYDYSGAINTNVTVAWSGGDFEKSLEQIITQKWIANFPNGMESWTEYRRTGYPKLMPMVANASGGIVNDAEGARRMPYPTDEYRENRESVEAAVATLTQESKTKRGDTMATHVWWDCK